jgi:Tol biopolymer transport system component
MKSLAILAFLALLIGCSAPSSNSISYSAEPVLTPALFAPGSISTSDNSEFHIAFSPDGKTVYFSRRPPEGKQQIYITHWKNGTWSTPEVAPFSTDRDETPFLTSNGERFFFGSERPIPGRPNKGNFDMNIWMMERTDAGWSNPIPLADNINEVQEEGEEWPMANNNFIFSLDDKTFYFTSMMRGRKASELYKTVFDGSTFSNPVRIDGLFDDSKYWVYGATISPDGQYLFFNSFGAPGGLGGEDIYVAKKTENGWSKAVAVGPIINTTGEEGGSRFSRDGKYFFFSHADHLGNYEYSEWSIYYIETAALQLEKLFP